MPKLVAFGKQFRALRERRELGIRALASRLRVSHTYISHIEANRVIPSEGFLLRAAELLNADPDELLLAAGRIPETFRAYVTRHPEKALSMLRESRAKWSAHPKPTKDREAQLALPIMSNLQFTKILGTGGEFEIIHDDCLEWMSKQPEVSFEAIVTDPPYGLIEYDQENLSKLRNGRGGIWRIPPRLGGHARRPVPRFTVHTPDDIRRMEMFFRDWGKLAFRILVPGSHLIIASNSLMTQHVYPALIESGFEMRGEIARIVRTLRGGDRPKGAEKEFEEVSVIPRACWEPWGLFRKPLDGTVAENVRRWKTGALRRPSPDQPFVDVIPSERTPVAEKALAPHPSLKPLSFMIQVVRAVLPLGVGCVLDPFAGAGTTLAAAALVGYRSVGVEINREYFELAKLAIPRLVEYGRRRYHGSSA
jgi:site-specific DNA-methyltransferase (adenine-specific)